MGLDAVVFCNCVETEKLKVPHPFPRLLHIKNDGRPAIRTNDAAKLAAHDAWMTLPPCKHGDMMVDGCSLGNASGVGVIYDALSRAQKSFRIPLPILLNNVLYSGTHCGDFLTLAQVRNLNVELKRLRRLKLTELGIATNDAKWIEETITNLARLVKVAQKVGKPIAF
jgi:hypothetical protein